MIKLRTLLRLLNHPVDEYEDMKYKKCWDVPLSLILLGLWFAATVMQRQGTNFKFNYNKLDDINILYIAASTVLLFFVWTAINWSITTLLDGKGNVREIFVSCAYALTPYIAATILNVLLSQFLVLEESTFIVVIRTVGMVWSVYLLITALRVIHSYSILKTLASIFLTIVGILFVLFLLVLLFGLIQQVFLFFQTIYVELMFRR